MTFGNLAARPDLGPLFGALSHDDNEGLLDRLLAIDEQLVRLADAASAHVGVPYRVCRLGFVGSSGIHGGPRGEPGDVGFDIRRSSDPASGKSVSPPWVVESVIVVFCSDAPEPRGSSSTHTLVQLEGTADTPTAVLDLLE